MHGTTTKTTHSYINIFAQTVSPGQERNIVMNGTYTAGVYDWIHNIPNNLNWVQSTKEELVGDQAVFVSA